MFYRWVFDAATWPCVYEYDYKVKFVDKGLEV